MCFLHKSAASSCYVYYKTAQICLLENRFFQERSFIFLKSVFGVLFLLSKVMQASKLSCVHAVIHRSFFFDTPPAKKRMARMFKQRGTLIFSSSFPAVLICCLLSPWAVWNMFSFSDSLTLYVVHSSLFC